MLISIGIDYALADNATSTQEIASNAETAVDSSNSGFDISLSSNPAAFTNGPVSIVQLGIPSVGATFTDNAANGIDSGTELSAFTGAGLFSFTNGLITISQGSNDVIATFTDSGSLGLGAGAEITNIRSIPLENTVIIESGSSGISCQLNDSCLNPSSTTISIGEMITWDNQDIATHTVVSGNPIDGADGIFNSGFIAPGESFSFVFNAAGNFPYYDVVHSWIIGTIDVVDLNPPPGIDILITLGSSVSGCQISDHCFTPSNFTVDFGGNVTWFNEDIAGHTVTSGTPGGGPDGEFDSGLITPGEEFSHQFLVNGTFPYYDVAHPWMVGSVVLNPPVCQIPISGDWVITQNCQLELIATIPGNVMLQNNSSLIILNGATLDIDFTNFNLIVESGSGVLIKQGGAIT